MQPAHRYATHARTHKRTHTRATIRRAGTRSRFQCASINEFRREIPVFRAIRRRFLGRPFLGDRHGIRPDTEIRLVRLALRRQADGDILPNPVPLTQSETRKPAKSTPILTEYLFQLPKRRPGERRGTLQTRHREMLVNAILEGRLAPDSRCLPAGNWRSSCRWRAIP